MLQIGSKIRRLRELKGISQDYMAAKLELSQQSYSNIERGEVKLTIERLSNIANVLGISVEDILTFDERTVFNNINNRDHSKNGMFIESNMPIRERELLEEQIKRLEEEVLFLRSIIVKTDGMLGTQKSK